MNIRDTIANGKSVKKSRAQEEQNEVFNKENTVPNHELTGEFENNENWTNSDNTKIGHEVDEGSLKLKPGQWRKGVHRFQVEDGAPPLQKWPCRSSPRDRAECKRDDRAKPRVGS